MSGRNDQEQLFDLMEEIERAWMERGEYTVVDRLAAKHPAVAEKLYLFFATMVDASDQLDRERPELAEQVKRIRQWLQDGGGFALAAASAPDPHGAETASSPTGIVERTPTASSQHRITFFGFLKKASHSIDPEAMASRLDVSVDFLREVSKHWDLLPFPVRRELAHRVEHQFHVSASLAMFALGEAQTSGRDAPAPLARAASRAGGKVFERRAVTFEELVNRSSMDENRRRFWLSLARD